MRCRTSAQSRAPAGACTSRTGTCCNGSPRTRPHVPRESVGQRRCRSCRVVRRLRSASVCISPSHGPSHCRSHCPGCCCGSPRHSWNAGWRARRAANRKRWIAHKRQFVRGTARRTWAFFERFVNAEENWLPPDNYQEQPIAKIAHRTSPTNIGLCLLANLSAYDLRLSRRRPVARTLRADVRDAAADGALPRPLLQLVRHHHAAAAAAAIRLDRRQRQPRRAPAGIARRIAATGPRAGRSIRACSRASPIPSTCCTVTGRRTTRRRCVICVPRSPTSNANRRMPCRRYAAICTR